MFEWLKKVIMSIIGGAGDFVGWLYDNVVPNSVKEQIGNQIAKYCPGGLTIKGMFMVIMQIFLHWYFYIVIISLIVLYKLVTTPAFQKILEGFSNIVYSAIGSVLYIAENCFPLMLNLSDMAKCIAGS
jgi:hypothetical protein